MDGTLKFDHSLESCRTVLYCGAVWFQLHPVGLGTVRSERVNLANKLTYFLGKKITLKVALVFKILPLASGPYLVEQG